MILQIMNMNQSPRKKKQGITTVGLQGLIDYFMAKITNIERRHTSVTAAYTVSHAKTCLTNTKKTATASTKTQQE